MLYFRAQAGIAAAAALAWNAEPDRYAVSYAEIDRAVWG
jgi:hypothetical protein